ncbi:hypothetical protein HEP84_51155 [Streptomyces sp. RLB1-33]|nr:hypothetical protein [Streptomyces sp. RLB1-33]QIY76062.1 hypothetical protein HEP84_51155 [Streptomyces sp. RLB1-33]
MPDVEWPIRGGIEGGVSVGPSADGAAKVCRSQPILVSRAEELEGVVDRVREGAGVVTGRLTAIVLDASYWSKAPGTANRPHL